MRFHFFAGLFTVLGCGSPVSLSVSDAGPDAGAADAGAPDAGVTFVGHIQPLLWAKCSNCHFPDAGQPAFASDYPVMLQPSVKCPGERVGDCVKRALEAQVPEGSGCRTVILVPFHREGWSCLTPTEIDRVVGWVDAGMLQQ